MATHNNNTSHPEPAASTAGGAKASRTDTLRIWLPRALLLGVIWGIAVFLWGTFGAWTRDQYIASEQHIARRQANAVDAWLEAATLQLDRLATDKRLAEGLELPAGVESLPVQRVLYEYAYLNGQSEVYMIDLLHRRVGSTAGATPLPDAVVERLAKLNGSRMIFGMGQRGGQMLLMRKVDAPLPNNAVVAIPVNLATLATQQPTYFLPAERELNLIVPHPSGWAEWPEGEAAFTLDDDMQMAMSMNATTYTHDNGLVVVVPLQNWPGVKLALHSPGLIGSARMLPQIMVGLWAIAMSILVLWQSGGAMATKVKAMVGPVVGPVAKLAKPVKSAIHKLSDALAVSLRSGNKDVPLVDGPGAFDKDDFLDGNEETSRLNRKRKRDRASVLKLNQNAPDEVKLGRKLPPLDDDRMKQPPHTMNWPVKDGEQPTDTPRFEEVDSEDIEAVVLDAMKKRRVRLMYQPIYRAGDNVPVMHEVYARLFRGDGKIITPDIFFPVITKLKMTLDLDLMVLRKVVNEHFNNGQTPMTPLALNISSTSLDGIAYLQEMAAQGPRVLQKISFEVSSQEMIRDPKALRLLKELQKHGGNLSVDYFGGGTAMLDASKAMGFNHVKMNCTRLIGTDAGKKEIITMCRHARGTGLPIILEMISDDEALGFARRAGAEFLQGYALTRPREHMSLEILAMPMEAAAAVTPQA